MGTGSVFIEPTNDEKKNLPEMRFTNEWERRGRCVTEKYRLQKQKSQLYCDVLRPRWFPFVRKLREMGLSESFRKQQCFGSLSASRMRETRCEDCDIHTSSPSDTSPTKS